jgi:hypothetical protein
MTTKASRQSHWRTDTPTVGDQRATGHNCRANQWIGRPADAPVRTASTVAWLTRPAGEHHWPVAFQWCYNAGTAPVELMPQP